MALQAPTEVRTRRFTADEVWRMVDVGIIHEDEPIELIDGQLIIVSPPGVATRKLDRALHPDPEPGVRGAVHRSCADAARRAA